VDASTWCPKPKRLTRVVLHARIELPIVNTAELVQHLMGHADPLHTQLLLHAAITLAPLNWKDTWTRPAASPASLWA
jgi:hypothetical protein